MNLKYVLGVGFQWGLETIGRSRYFALSTALPRGYSWLYDIKRYSGGVPAEIVFDVGAHVGQTAARILRFLPNAEIYCFEPSDEQYSVLAQKFSNRENVRTSNVALGACVERRTFSLRADSERNALVESDRAEGKRVEVDVMTLDHFTEREGIDHIDILKVDVEGWEVKVLEGGRRLIEESAIVYILAEAAFRENRMDKPQQQQFAELHKYMERSGFILSGFYDAVRYGPRREFTLFANVLYINPAAREKWIGRDPKWADWIALHQDS